MSGRTGAGTAGDGQVPHGPRLRVTGLLVEDGRLLVVHEVLREREHWNLPGGKVELGETIEQALVREMREECGISVEVCDLLYVCDRFKGLGNHVVDMSFSVRRTGGPLPTSRLDPAGDDRIVEVRMAPIDELASLGFSERFVSLVSAGFPDKGSYQGDFHAFYDGETGEQTRAPRANATEAAGPCSSAA